jgi:hypothetical protein
MSTLTNTNLFGITKTEALQKGMEIRSRFQQIVEKVATTENGTKYPHTYLFSPPGIGKTFSVTKYLEECGKPFVKVSGNVSMFAFGIQLAVINFENIEKEKVIIFIDDTDSLLSSESSLNQFKLMLDNPRTFTYEKSLQSQWSNLTDLQVEAVKAHQNEKTCGFVVPCENFVFIFGSNIKLPTDDVVSKAREKNQAKTGILSGKNAIRSRCNVYDFDLDYAELWGFLGDVILHTNCLDPFELSNEQKIDILDFLWDNWEFLTERSIRLVEKMAIGLNDYPDHYKTIWSIDFLK